jgi:hypothetical protein
LALYVILLPLLTYALIVLCVIPSVYAQSAYPESRALISARLIMIIAIMTAGGMLSLIIHVLLSSSTETHSYLQLSVLVLLGIIWIYPIYAARNIYVDIPRYQRWAVFWDERDEEIRKAKQNNVMDVEVIKIDHIIPSVGDLSDDTGYWYNLCAAGYYGIHSISANQPGWEYSQP